MADEIMQKPEALTKSSTDFVLAKQKPSHNDDLVACLHKEQKMSIHGYIYTCSYDMVRQSTKFE